MYSIRFTKGKENALLNLTTVRKIGVFSTRFYSKLPISSWVSILYTGVMSCSIAYTLQILGQKETEPAIASMILCLESVFALIAGMIILGEVMTFREIIGCVIMFAAIFVANLPEDALRVSGTK